MAVDIVSFGSEDDNTEKLDAFLEAVNSGDNSHLVSFDVVLDRKPTHWEIARLSLLPLVWATACRFLWKQETPLSGWPSQRQQPPCDPDPLHFVPSKYATWPA